MGFLGRLLLGDGRLRPDLRAALESEGLVVLEEGLGGSLRYHHFRAPGRRFHGKVTPERIGLGISERRVVLYCRSGRVKLVDTEFDDPRLSIVDFSLDGNGKVAVRVDYDRADEAKVAGQITIRAKTPNAAHIVDQLHARVRATNLP
ncbi:MAG TPA: hypothetical protein VNB64_12580 [Solirubrobacteraceae bacterium]|nr:hypothetical protein [Solirubrobacteraceae bacterium]